MVYNSPDFSPSVYWVTSGFAVPCPFHRREPFWLYVPYCHNPILIRTIHSIATIMMRKPHTTSKRRPQFLLFLYRNLIDSLLPWIISDATKYKWNNKKKNSSCYLYYSRYSQPVYNRWQGKKKRAIPTHGNQHIPITRTFFLPVKPLSDVPYIIN